MTAGRIYKTTTLAHRLRRGLRLRHMQTRLLDADRALFECVCLSCGFVFTEQLIQGPRGQRKPASADACRLYARVWGGYGHSLGVCPLCSDPARRALR